jgi:hypothetical protein
MVELVNEGSVMASLVGERGGVCSSERTLYVIAVVPLSVPVMVRLPKMAPEKVKTEAAAGAVSEVVVKTVETGMKVVVGKLVMARAEAPVISTKQFREGVMRVLTGAARTLAKSLLEGCEGENPSKCTLTWFATAVVAVFLTV